jgi:hypothetical protein
MYKKVLLAYDGSIEGRRALREGAKLAQLCRAEVFLLAVVELTPIISPDTGLAIPIDEQTANYKAVLSEGVERLKALGFHLPRGWKLEMQGKKLQNSPKKSEHTLSSLVIGRKGRWHGGGSGLSAATWSSVFAAAFWLPKRRSATMNLSS